ncbi:hypothetical protein [Hathewaya massiliensis]|uniref:hypothetical protein n=1 Tax=Hathewaya massiliensis TaxID=1964382 RepID=UPI0011575123|nr:hypothetical protein [Hathewaya massiliensis]
MNEKDRKKIFSLIEWRKGLECINGMEDYYWEPLTTLLTKNEDDTIGFLRECSDEQIYWISEVFEDISDKFQSKRFLEFLKELQYKHSNIDIKQDLQAAEYRLAEE